MKIIFLNGNLVIRENKSGVHFFHENIMRGLIKKNLEFNTLFFNFMGKNSKLLDDIKNEWIKERVVQNKILHRIFLYFLPIELFIGKRDIYVCDGWIPFTIFKSKKIAIVHDLMSKIYPENYNSIMKLYLYTYFRRIKKADRVIAVSETTKADIIKFLNIPSDKIEVIYNGIDNEYLNNIKNFEEIDRNDINFNNKYIFYIGEMRKNKNLFNAIKGFEKYYLETKDDIYFYIAGKKSFEYENIYEYIKNSTIKDRVKFLGYVSDEIKLKLYKHSFAFIFISFYEGFGIPILEAMMMKTPVITSNCSSMKEIAEGASILVEPTDINEIYKKIVELNDNDTRKSIIEEGYKRVENFTWDDSINKFKEVLINGK